MAISSNRHTGQSLRGQDILKRFPNPKLFFLLTILLLTLPPSLQSPNHSLDSHTNQTVPTPTSASVANPTVLTLNTSGSGLESAVVDFAAGYGYFGSGANPGMIFKIQLSNFAYAANITFNAGQNGAAAAALDPIRHTAYFGTFSGQIVKIDLRSFTEIASIAPNLGPIASTAIDPAGGFAYFGTSTTPGNIIRIRLSDFSFNGTLNLGRLGGASSMAIDLASGYGYFGTSGCGLGIFTPLPPDVIVKVKLSDLNMNKTQQLTLPTSNCLSSADIDPAGGFAYFAGSGFSGSGLVRIRLSDFSLAGVLSPGPANAVSSLALDPARGLMYAGEGGLAFSTIRLSDYNQIGSVYAYSQNGPLFNQRAAALDLASGDAYFTASTV